MAVTDGIREYMSRDWKLLEDSKELFWEEQRGALGAEEMLRIAGELFELARVLHPGWPCDEDREEDLEAHRRLSELFRRADIRSRL